MRLSIPTAQRRRRNSKWAPLRTDGTEIPIVLNPNNGVIGQNASSGTTGLTPGLTYHFRVSATNSGGTNESADVAFATISNDPNLAALVPSSGVLTPAFTSGNTSYNDSVPFLTATMTVTPTGEQSSRHDPGPCQWRLI